MAGAALSLQWPPTAERELRRLPEKVARAVLEFVYGSLSDHPERMGRELQSELAGHHLPRRGDHRVNYEDDRPAGAVVIVHVDHRTDVYRRT